MQKWQDFGSCRLSEGATEVKEKHKEFRPVNHVLVVVLRIIKHPILGNSV